MSEAFEEVFTAFMNNRVPAMWHKKGYNSLKSLGSWIHDLTLRIDFMEVSIEFLLQNFVTLSLRKTKLSKVGHSPGELLSVF